MWEGGEAWVIGGGTSIPRQFGVSEEIIESVNAGSSPLSVYSEYFKAIHDKNVVGVNVAFKLGGWISAMYFCDSGFWKCHHDELINFKNLKVTDVSSLPRHLRELAIKHNVKRLQRNYARNGLSSNPSQINWNYNSGAAAINFAALAGAKRIYLLGFDCQLEEGRSHWHQGEMLYTKPSNKRVFNRFLEMYPLIAKDAKKMGVEIINVNPDSAITVFPKLELKDIL